MRSKQASHIDLDVNSGPEAFDDLFIDPPNLVRLYGPVLTGHFIHYSSKSDSMKLIPFQLTSKRGISSGNSSQQAFIKHQLCVTGGWAGNAEMEVTQILLIAQWVDVSECLQCSAENTVLVS